jgi:type VI secretion system protein ImpJ
MDSIKSLYWNQGLFLKPQHFQHLDKYISATSNAYSKARCGTDSGIFQLKFDLSALKLGLITIESFECILDDGTLISYPGNSQISSLKLEQSSVDEAGIIEIYISLGSLSAEQSNLASNTTPNARFTLAPDVDTKDIFDANEQAPLSTLNFNCKLMTEALSRSSDDAKVIKIAELNVVSDEYVLSESYIPKITLLSGSETLKNLVKKTRVGLISRFEQLQNISSFDGGLANNSNNVSVGLAMMAIGNNIASFNQFEDDDSTLPSDIYLAYRQLISQLSVFSKDVSVTGESAVETQSIIPFNRNNLSDCFSRANKLTIKLLNELTIKPELLINMVHQGGSKFVAPLSSEFLAANTRIYLRVRTKENLLDDMDSRLDFVKVGADGQVDVYLKRALPGAELSYLNKKPQGVATVPDSYYFNIDRQSYQWQKVIEMRRIGIIWNDAPEDIVIELIAVQG